MIPPSSMLYCFSASLLFCFLCISASPFFFSLLCFFVFFFFCLLASLLFCFSFLLVCFSFFFSFLFFWFVCFFVLCLFFLLLCFAWFCFSPCLFVVLLDSQCRYAPRTAPAARKEQQIQKNNKRNKKSNKRNKNNYKGKGGTQLEWSCLCFFLEGEALLPPPMSLFSWPYLVVLCFLFWSFWFLCIGVKTMRCKWAG